MPVLRSSVILCAAATMALGACAVGPRYVRPSPPDAAYAPSSLAEVSASASVQGGAAQHFRTGGDIPYEWWELFQSPLLNSMIERALKANPTISAAQATLAQAQEIVSAQRGFFYPSVGASFQAERHKVSGNTNSSSTIGVQGNGVNLLPKIPESADSLKSFPHSLPSYYSFYTAQLTVGFVPDVLGGNRRQVESLAAQAETQRFALDAACVTLASNIAAAVIQEASLQAQLRATERIIDVERQVVGILQEQFRLGFAMRLDVAAQEALLAQSTATLPPLQKQLEQTRDLIRTLLGTLPTHEQETVELDSLQLPQELPLSLPGNLIEHRPDVRAAEAQLHAANANVGAATAAMLPQFEISGQYGGNATQISQMFSSNGPFWNLIGNVNQPVFQGGTLLHERRAAGAALNQGAAQYRNTVIVAYQNVADALHVSLADAETLAADVDAERAAKITFDLTRRQSEAGYVTYLNLLNAETAYQQTLLTRVQAQATRYGDTVALFQALGGGWWNRRDVAGR